jgi:hypothetical protein
MVVGKFLRFNLFTGIWSPESESEETVGDFSHRAGDPAQEQGRICARSRALSN